MADASTATNDEIEDGAISLSSLNLAVLINNVGGSSVIKPLVDHSSDQVDMIMNLNARFPIQLTRALLPYFVKNSDPTLIMTIGSLGDAYGVPYAVPYASSKGFNMSTSASLDLEVRTEDNNIEVIGILVGAVTEVGHKANKPTFFTPGARTMAKAALARVGCGRPVVVGYFGHALQKFLLDVLPNAVRESFIIPVMKDYRERA